MAALTYDPQQVALARQRQRFSTAQVALLLDLSQAAYEALEAGSGLFSEAQLQKLTLLFRTTLSELQGPPAAVQKPRQARNKPKPKPKRSYAKPSISSSPISAEELAAAQQADPEATYQSLQFIQLVTEIIVSKTLAELEQARQLEKQPGGFHPERSQPCVLCGDQVQGEKAWFDQNGHTCRHCCQALRTGLIPAALSQDKQLYYTEIELELYFQLDKRRLNQLLKTQQLHTRSIPRQDQSGTHLRLFLHQDNPGFFPPKTLLKGGIARVLNEKGAEEYAFLPWYCFHDPNTHLQPYGIARLLRWAPGGP